MKIYLINKKKRYLILTIGIVIISIMLSLSYYGYNINKSHSAFNSDEELIKTINEIFINRNKEIVNEGMDLIKPMYDLSTKYGKWSYEYEQRKEKYIHNWEQKQGVEFIDIIPKVLVKNIKKYDNKYSVTLQCVTEYKYVYVDRLDEVNISRIGTTHVLDLVYKNNKWVIGKEWYNDPFASSLNLNNLKVDSIKQYILSQTSRDLSNINERRVKAVEYADMYNGASNIEGYEYRYNKKYRNYNPLGGDCANFASQVLFEGGNFRKTSGWNYNSGEATRAWVNAGGFTSYMLNSKRASLIAYGSYEKVYKESYKLLPGDFIAYEDKGDITHVSVVTDADSRGYTLVSCHNTDRDKVPWDLGWSNKSIKFWLVRIHY